MADELDAIRALMVLVETLRQEGEDTGPGGAQAEQDRERIEAIIAQADWNPVGPFRCPIVGPNGECRRSYPTADVAARCWQSHPHTHLFSKVVRNA